MWVFALVLGMIAALLQSTFIPAVKISGGVIEIGVMLTLLFLFFGSLREASVFLVIFAIFSTIFSQIPLIYFLLPTFVVIVIFIFLSRRRIISRPGTLLSFLIFLIGTIIADLVKLLIMARFSLHNLLTVLIDALLTAFVGAIIYFLISKIYRYLNPQLDKEKIKLAE